MQAAALILPGVLFWVDIEQRDGKQTNIDALALEHRLTGDEGAIKDLGNRMDRLGDWLKKGKDK